MAFTATQMDLEMTILRVVSQKDKYYMISLICGILKKIQMNLQKKIIDIENRLIVTKGGG